MVPCLLVDPVAAAREGLAISSEVYSVRTLKISSVPFASEAVAQPSWSARVVEPIRQVGRYWVQAPQTEEGPRKHLGITIVFKKAYLTSVSLLSDDDRKELMKGIYEFLESVEKLDPHDPGLWYTVGRELHEPLGEFREKQFGSKPRLIIKPDPINRSLTVVDYHDYKLSPGSDQDAFNAAVLAADRTLAVSGRDLVNAEAWLYNEPEAGRLSPAEFDIVRGQLQANLFGPLDRASSLEKFLWPHGPLNSNLIDTNLKVLLGDDQKPLLLIAIRAMQETLELSRGRPEAAAGRLLGYGGTVSPDQYGQAERLLEQWANAQERLLGFIAGCLQGSAAPSDSDWQMISRVLHQLAGPAFRRQIRLRIEAWADRLPETEEALRRLEEANDILRSTDPEDPFTSDRIRNSIAERTRALEEQLAAGSAAPNAALEHRRTVAMRRARKMNQDGIRRELERTSDISDIDRLNERLNVIQRRRDLARRQRELLESAAVVSDASEEELSDSPEISLAESEKTTGGSRFSFVNRRLFVIAGAAGLPGLVLAIIFGPRLFRKRTPDDNVSSPSSISGTTVQRQSAVLRREMARFIDEHLRNPFDPFVISAAEEKLSVQEILAALDTLTLLDSRKGWGLLWDFGTYISFPRHLAETTGAKIERRTCYINPGFFAAIAEQAEQFDQIQSAEAAEQARQRRELLYVLWLQLSMARALSVLEEKAHIRRTVVLTKLQMSRAEPGYQPEKFMQPDGWMRQYVAAVARDRVPFTRLAAKLLRGPGLGEAALRQIRRECPASVPGFEGNWQELLDLVALDLSNPDAVLWHALRYAMRPVKPPPPGAESTPRILREGGVNSMPILDYLEIQRVHGHVRIEDGRYYPSDPAVLVDLKDPILLSANPDLLPPVAQTGPFKFTPDSDCPMTPERTQLAAALDKELGGLARSLNDADDPLSRLPEAPVMRYLLSGAYPFYFVDARQAIQLELRYVPAEDGVTHKIVGILGTQLVVNLDFVGLLAQWAQEEETRGDRLRASQYRQILRSHLRAAARQYQDGMRDPAELIDLLDFVKRKAHNDTAIKTLSPQERRDYIAKNVRARAGAVRVLWLDLVSHGLTPSAISQLTPDDPSLMRDFAEGWDGYVVPIGRDSFDEFKLRVGSVRSRAGKHLGGLKRYLINDGFHICVIVDFVLEHAAVLEKSGWFRPNEGAMDFLKDSSDGILPGQKPGASLIRPYRGQKLTSRAA